MVTHYQWLVRRLVDLYSDYIVSIQWVYSDRTVSEVYNECIVTAQWLCSDYTVWVVVLIACLVWCVSGWHGCYACLCLLRAPHLRPPSL